MIVTCERCATQFQLDDARIPPGGVRVRCSRCRHAFEIELPSLDASLGDALPGETLPDLPLEPPALDALGESPVLDPFGESSDLGSLDGPAFGGADEPDLALDDESGFGLADEPTSTDDFGPAFDGSERGPSLRDETLDDEESDWEFNDDLPDDASAAAPKASEHRAAADVVDQFLGSPRTAPGVDAVPLREPSEQPSGLDLADQAVEPPGQAPDPLAALATRPARRAEAGVAEDPLRADSLSEPTEGVDELGSPEEWDLFAPESGAKKSSKPSVRLPPPLLADRDAVIAERSHWAGWLARAGEVAGWIVVAALFAQGVVGAIAPRAGGSGSSQLGFAGDLEVLDASGVWIDNAVAGSIYVISGNLRNPGSSGVASQPLAVELLDAQGQRVMDRPVPLEAPHSRRNLRELAPADLPGRAPATGPEIAPGASVPFQAVVGPIPPEARSYRVVVASPSRRKGRPATASPETSRPAAPRAEPPSGLPEQVAEHEPVEPIPADEALPASSPAAPAP